MAMTTYLLKSTITGALGGLLFGFDTAVIAGTTQQLTVVYHLTSFTLGLTVSIGLAGTVLGAMTSGVIGQRIGGREALRIMAILYTISALGCAFAWNWPALMVFRFIGGPGHRRIFRPWPGLYRGACTCKMARLASRNVSDQHRHRHSSCLSIQLPNLTPPPW
jgi:MFS family permease